MSERTKTTVGHMLGATSINLMCGRSSQVVYAPFVDGRGEGMLFETLWKLCAMFVGVRRSHFGLLKLQTSVRTASGVPSHRFGH